MGIFLNTESSWNVYKLGFIKYVSLSIFHVAFYMNFLLFTEECTFWFCSVGNIKYKFFLFYSRHAISMLLLAPLNLKCETWYAKEIIKMLQYGSSLHVVSIMTTLEPPWLSVAVKVFPQAGGTDEYWFSRV